MNDYMPKLGDIFECSWGYGQRNVDFYQVTKIISEKTMELCRIESMKIDDSHVIPVPKKIIGRKRRRKINADGWIRITSFSSACIWDGKPCYQTPDGYGY